MMKMLPTTNTNVKTPIYYLRAAFRTFFRNLLLTVSNALCRALRIIDSALALLAGVSNNVARCLGNFILAIRQFLLSNYINVCKQGVK